ncbi:hypothetical protein ACIPUC_12785 [Streptomyces sp. LARHCF249]
MTQTSAMAPPPPGTEPRPGMGRDAKRDLRRLGAVAAVFTLAQLAFVLPGSGLGWDETVYVSQVSPHAPAAFFSAPRARGITFLVAPVAALTSSVVVLRVYLALLSGAGLLLALWVWRRLLPTGTLAVAGALFAGLWISVLYGPQAMPNLWVAYGALIAVGCFLRATRDRSDRAAVAGLGAGMALAALMRPSDALWLALPLVAAALSVRSLRRPALLLVLGAGAAAGGAEWMFEAYVRYGGLLPRLRRASEIQGNLGWNPAFDDHVRALQGVTLCRPCTVPLRHPLASVWWFVVPLLAAGGVRAAARTRRPAVIVLPALAGLSMAAPYLLLIGYAAPRFLLPAYALLALPTALCLTRMAALARPRPVLRTGLALAVAAHLTVQFLVLDSVTDRGRATHAAFDLLVADLRRQGLRPPCVVSGEEAVRIAFRAGCSSRQVGGHDGSITPAELAAAARSRPVALIVRGHAPPPGYAEGWRRHVLHGPPGLPDLRAYLGPATGARPVSGSSSGVLPGGPDLHCGEFRREDRRRAPTAQVLQGADLCLRPGEQPVQVGGVETGVGGGERAQRPPARGLALDAQQHRLELQYVAERGARQEPAVQLEPPHHLRGPAHRLAQRPNRNVKAAHDPAQTLLVLFDLPRQGGQFRPVVRTAVPVRDPVDQAYTGTRTGEVVIQVHGEEGRPPRRGQVLGVVHG